MDAVYGCWMDAATVLLYICIYIYIYYSVIHYVFMHTTSVQTSSRDA